MKLFIYLLYMISVFHFSTGAHAAEIGARDSTTELSEDAETAAQWGLAAIGANKAYQAGFTGEGVLVGIIDSGLDVAHPEFAGRVSSSSLDIEASLNAGMAVPVSGDEEGHGTFVGGILAANRDGSGMHGVAYAATLVPASGDFGPETFDVYTAIGLQYLARQGVEIANISLGVDEDEVPPNAGREFIEGYIPRTLFSLRETGQQGLVTVWAAGNAGDENAELTARMPHYFPELENTTLAVVALDRAGSLATYSNRCGIAALWCLAAPGGAGERGGSEGVMSTWAGGGYSTEAGTSFAAPHVTGALAVARQIFPDADVRDLRKLILKTAADLGQPGVDAVFGWGKLDLGNVVDTIAPAGRSVFASSAWSRHLAMQQVAHMPFSGSLQRGSSHRQFWMNGGVMRGGIDAASGLPGAQARGQALTLGVDVIERSDLVAGLGFGFTRTRTDESGLSNSASAKGYHGLGYLRWDDEHWYVKSAAGISYFRQDHVRRDISGLAGTTYSLSNPVARSKQSALGLFADMEAGRKVDFRGLDTAVFARLSSTYQRFGAARESGVDILGYELEAGSVSTLGIGPGIRFSKRFDLGNWQVVPELELSYTRLLGSNDFSSGTALLGRKMEARTTPLGRDVFGIGAKLDFILPGSGVTAALGYAGSFRKSAEQQKVQLGLSIKF